MRLVDPPAGGLISKIIGRAPSRKLTKRGGKLGLPVILALNQFKYTESVTEMRSRGRKVMGRERVNFGNKKEAP